MARPVRRLAAEPVPRPIPGLLPILIGLDSLAVRYVATKEQRDFVLHSQLVARRYDVLCQSRTAEHGRDLLAALAMKAPLTV